MLEKQISEERNYTEEFRDKEACLIQQKDQINSLNRKLTEEKGKFCEI
jgi:hypothetical protein